MAKETSRLLLPFPEDTDAPDGAAQMKSLAERLDLVVPKFYTPKIIATEQSRENAAFGLLGTADEIASVVVPTNGLLLIGYTATWKTSVEGTGAAAIFLGANQLKANTVAQEIKTTGVGAGVKRLLYTTASGLSLGATPEPAARATTGETLGQSGALLPVFAAAGTYNISVQFKASSGTVTALERKLWVVVLGNS